MVVEPTLNLEVNPAAGMVDQPVEISVSGLPAGGRIEIRASLRDDRKRLWESGAAFIVDASGRVCLSEHAPIAGSYRDVDAMGLFWSLALDPARNGPATPFTKKQLSAAIVDVTVEWKHRIAAAASLERTFFATGTRIRELREDGLLGRMFAPAGAAKRPCVIVMGGSGGGLDWEKAAVLSSHGYATLALAYFGMPGLPGHLENIPLEYFAGAMDWVRRQPDVDGDRIALLGMSRGAELALLLGARFQQIRAVIAVVPSAVVWPGFGRGLHSAWTFEGQPLPFVPTPTRWFRMESFFRTLAGQPIAFRQIYEAALENREAVERAAIPVERIRGPILLISGTEDEVWPSTRMAQMIVERLVANGFSHLHEHLCCEGAGHLFRSPYLPTTVRMTRHPSMPVEVLLGGNAAAHARAQVAVWRRTLQFLRQNL